jgi:hypothetical protein
MTRLATDRWHKDNTIPRGDWIWVFGSNTAGRHGKGAAKVAHVSFGARYQVGRGLTGNAYAIPTKDGRLNVLSIDEIKTGIQEFVLYAKEHPKQQFFVTRVGCDLAGFSNEEIAPLFADAPLNCSFAEEWREFHVEQVSMPLVSCPKSMECAA